MHLHDQEVVRKESFVAPLPLQRSFRKSVGSSLDLSPKAVELLKHSSLDEMIDATVQQHDKLSLGSKSPRSPFADAVDAFAKEDESDYTAARARKDSAAQAADFAAGRQGGRVGSYRGLSDQGVDRSSIFERRAQGAPGATEARTAGEIAAYIEMEEQDNRHGGENKSHAGVLKQVHNDLCCEVLK